MSRQFSVMVLCPNGRRESLKVSSNSSILQILEEACTKQKLNPGDYDLWHYKKPLDLSLPIRFANLPNNALLELQPAKNPRKECMVTVALQLESGERVMKDFTPSSTLWDILKQCSQVDSTSSEETGEPVCIYMRQQITGEAIKTTTLRSLGLMQGTAIIRLLHRKPEQLENQAHISSPLTANTLRTQEIIKTTETKPSMEENSRMESGRITSVPQFEDQHKSTSMDIDTNDNNLPPTAVNNNAPFSTANIPAVKMGNEDAGKNGEQMECDFDDSKQTANLDWNRAENNVSEAPSGSQVVTESDSVVEEEFEEIGSINYIGERHAVLYSLEDITDTKKADLPDEFFELTIDDVKYLMRDYQKERIQLQNQPLQTREQRERQILQKLAQYSQTVIRVYFPERLVIQAVFSVAETVQDVQDFVRNYLENKELNFYLYTTPPKVKLITSKNILESMLVPAAVVYFGSDVQLPAYLMSSLRSMKSDPRAAALAASESRKASGFQNDMSVPTVNIPLKVENPLESPSTSSSDLSQSDGTRPKSAKIPKWMKLSKN